MKTSTIKQTVTCKASPHEVYETLIDSAKHSQFTGAKAQISRKVGGKFSVYGGWIEGKNVELMPDKKNCPNLARRQSGRRVAKRT